MRLKEAVVIIQTNTSGHMFGGLAQEYDLISTSSTSEALKICEQNKNNVASIVMGSDIKDPIQMSQRFHRLDKSLSVIILTRPENVEPMRRSISFTPFLGNSTICLSETNINDLETEISKAIKGTVKQRQAKSLSDKMNVQLSGIIAEKHKVLTISKEYLERLFDSAPIGIMTLTEEGNILALNKASSEMFRITEQEFIGISINNILSDFILIPDRIEVVSKEINGEKKYFEITITTVSGQDQSTGYLLLVLDITDKKNYEKALEKAVKVRDEFLSIASHELKTPITSLQLQLQLTKRSIVSSEEASSATLSRIVRSTDIALVQVRRLTLLVEDLLDVSKIESGKLHFNFQEVNVSDLIHEIMGRLSQHASAVNCEIKLDIPENLNLMTDPLRFDQIVTNLMMNAFKYASGKPVELTVTELKDFIRFSVKDYGMGIEPEKRFLIFQRFERGISHQNISGLGLGLYITKNIVDIHGGKISVESSLGAGATFIVDLPKKRPGF